MVKKVFKITGMHCVSCSINIDGELEDTLDIKSAKTSYAKLTTEVVMEDDSITDAKIIAIIKKLGYDASLVS